MVKYYVAIAAVFILSASAYGKSATLGGTSFSIEMDAALTNVGINYIFTTYDGDRYGWPYY